jgi:hypothetical protein
MGASMPIDRLLQQSSLPPDTIARPKVAYARTMSSLGLVDRNDPITELVAKKLIEVAQRGIEDHPDELCRITLEDLGINPSSH